MLISRYWRAGILLALALIVLAGAPATASDLRGTARVGWTFLDHDGNQGVYQPTYNLYEGGAVSLENFRYIFDQGYRLYGNLENLTLNNRNLRVGFDRPGHAGVNFTHNKYRRVYSFEGGNFTRREQTHGNAWYQPIESVRLFGGYGRVEKHGRALELIEPAGGDPLNLVDYSQDYYHGGAQYTHGRSRVRAEFRGTSYSDAIDDSSDRTTRRYRITAVSPLPRCKHVLLNAGFQRYEGYVSNRDDSLFANTFWAGGRFSYRGGWSLRYSFFFDRARRTGDLAATDNIVNAIYAGKTFKQLAGIDVGYRYHINDDVVDELKGNSYFASGWLRPVPDVTLRAGYGTENVDVNAGRTLTGDRESDRYWASAQYRLPEQYGSVRVKIEDKQTENPDISSSADFLRGACDFFVQYAAYGELRGSYTYQNGEYTNAAGTFEFSDHIISGEFWTAEYRRAKIGFGGTYQRSRQDLDIESFTLRFSGVYRFLDDYRVEGSYSAYNFDDLSDFNDRSTPYTRYYTENVVEISIARDF